jgi:hypothetical protein
VLALRFVEFNLDSIELSKDTLNHQDLKFLHVGRYFACQLRQMWRAADRAGSSRILRYAQFASSLEMRDLYLLL